MSGLTPTGFIAATTTSIQTSIQSDELALIDPALNLSPVQPLGQLNGIFASAAANLWALVQSIYAAIDPNGAVGVQLDNLCALTGCTRSPATKTLVLCNATLAAGTYAPGALMANIATQPALTFVNRDTIVSPGGLVTGLYWVATTTGPITANAGTLTTITSPVTGWTTITNPTAGTTGANIETDTALRLRRAATLVTPAGSSLDSIRAALLVVPGVIGVSMLENATTTTTFGFPANSYGAIIWDGPSPAASNDAIAQVLWNTKPAGITVVGFSAMQGNAVDALGVTHVMPFSRVTQLTCYVTMTVRVSAKLWNFTTGLAQVQAAILALSTTVGPDGFILGPGQIFYAAQAQAAAMTVPGVLAFDFFATGTSPAPTVPTDIGVSPLQIASLSPANVNIGLGAVV